MLRPRFHALRWLFLVFCLGALACDLGDAAALFPQDDSLRAELSNLDVLSLSPLEALNKLFELAEKAKESKDRNRA